MIGSLKGQARGPSLVETISGVGYSVTCLTPLLVGEEVDILVTTIVREDAITLYGFDTRAEQALFEALLKVSGVGAALAMAILNDVGVSETVNALKNEDTKTLTKAKGLGAAKAKKMCLDFKMTPEVAALADGNVEKVSGIHTSLTATLVDLGYPETMVTEAVALALASTDNLEDALRSAISYLASNRGA